MAVCIGFRFVHVHVHVHEQQCLPYMHNSSMQVHMYSRCIYTCVCPGVIKNEWHIIT